MAEPLSFRIKSRIENLTPIEQRILQYAASQGFDDEAQFSLRLAIDEAVVNAIIHGNQNDERKEVLIRVRFQSSNIYVSVCDEGRGFDRSTLSDPRKEPYLHEPTGRGIFLIQEFTDHVWFNERGNEITFVVQQTTTSPTTVRSV